MKFYCILHTLFKLQNGWRFFWNFACYYVLNFFFNPQIHECIFGILYLKNKGS